MTLNKPHPGSDYSPQLEIRELATLVETALQHLEDELIEALDTIDSVDRQAIAELARRATVSPDTVQRILRWDQTVLVSTRRKVFEAASNVLASVKIADEAARQYALSHFEERRLNAIRRALWLSIRPAPSEPVHIYGRPLEEIKYCGNPRLAAIVGDTMATESAQLCAAMVAEGKPGHVNTWAWQIPDQVARSAAELVNLESNIWGHSLTSAEPPPFRR